MLITAIPGNALYM